MYQHKNFVKQAGSSHWNKLELTCLPPARMTVTQLMSTQPHMQEARERFKKIGEGHFVWCVVFLVAGWPGLDKGTLFLVPHVWKSHTHHLCAALIWQKF